MAGESDISLGQIPYWFSDEGMARMEAIERVEFRTQEYQRDATLRFAHYILQGSADTGWSIERDGAPYLTLGAGYRALRTRACGVCSTDLDRHHLPFALPQVTGHEVLAQTRDGARVTVEINASHAGRGIHNECPFCRQGLSTHCPERLVLGINSLPGGFGPWVLAPVECVVPVPATVSDDSAVLIEPFAAALKAIMTIDLRSHDTVAVLGPRRLGMLTVAALAAYRRDCGFDFRILALARRQELLDVAAQFGADETRLVIAQGADLPSELADIVIDCTGSPSGLELAIRLARRELHVKSTHGQAVAGLNRLTQMVVDEVAIGRLSKTSHHGEAYLERMRERSKRTPLIAWLARTAPPDWLLAGSSLHRCENASSALALMEKLAESHELPRADVVVTDCAAQIDAAIRPDPQAHRSVVRPGGDVLLVGNAVTGVLVEAVLMRGLRVSSSRCGSFRAAIALLEGDGALLHQLDKLITHHFPATQLAEALKTARSPAAIKVVVTHPENQE